jgi:cytidylate kinase
MVWPSQGNRIPGGVEEAAAVSGRRILPERCVVAVDGPSGSGKSTVSRRLATALDARYLDTGSMYRAATWAVLEARVDLDDSAAVAKVVRAAQLLVGTDPAAPSIAVDGVDVAVDIRGPEVTGAVSTVAAVPAVRETLVAAQRAIIGSVRRIVVEGRDIARVVAPDAQLKVFLTASAAERARRRSLEHSSDLAATAADLDRRDHLDSTRAVDPLRRSADAVTLDTTTLGIDEVVDQLLNLLTEQDAEREPA